MKYYFCLDGKDVMSNGSNPGREYVYDHKEEWIPVPGDEYCKYLTAGYVKGVDYAVYKGIAYLLFKSFIDSEENAVILLCTESMFGCDQ